MVRPCITRFVVTATLAALPSVAGAQPCTIRVGPSAGNDFSDVCSAIASSAVHAGSVVCVERDTVGYEMCDLDIEGRADGEIVLQADPGTSGSLPVFALPTTSPAAARPFFTVRGAHWRLANLVFERIVVTDPDIPTILFDNGAREGVVDHVTFVGSSVAVAQNGSAPNLFVHRCEMRDSAAAALRLDASAIVTGNVFIGDGSEHISTSGEHTELWYNQFFGAPTHDVRITGSGLTGESFLAVGNVFFRTGGSGVAYFEGRTGRVLFLHNSIALEDGQTVIKFATSAPETTFAFNAIDLGSGTGVVFDSGTTPFPSPDWWREDQNWIDVDLTDDSRATGSIRGPDPGFTNRSSDLVPVATSPLVDAATSQSYTFVSVDGSSTVISTGGFDQPEVPHTPGTRSRGMPPRSRLAIGAYEPVASTPFDAGTPPIDGSTTAGDGDATTVFTDAINADATHDALDDAPGDADAADLDAPNDAVSIDGAPLDAPPPTDAGGVSDANADAGAVAEAGPTPDASADAGLRTPEFVGFEGGGGCRCAVPVRANRNFGLLALVALLGLVGGARRRRTPPR